MIYPKLLTLAYKLARSTESGAVKWEATEVEDLFQTSFARSSVRIGVRESKSSESSEYFIRVINADGEIVAEMGDEEPEDRDERIELFNTLRAMHESAMHHASGADDILDEILQEIERDNLSF